MTDFGIIAIPVIVIITYLVCETFKATEIDNKWLPPIAGFSGGLLGIVALILMPDFPAGDVLTAIAIGIVSGLAATGTNQLFKQFKQ